MEWNENEVQLNSTPNSIQIDWKLCEIIGAAFSFLDSCDLESRSKLDQNQNTKWNTIYHNKFELNQFINVGMCANVTFFTQSVKQQLLPLSQ